MPLEALSEAPQDAAARELLMQERSVWMARDLYQAGTTRTMCERNAELVDLIRRNNAEAE